MNPDNQAPQTTTAPPSASSARGSASSKLSGLKNPFVLASFGCLAVAVLGSLLGWVKLNIDLGEVLTNELNLSTKQNTVVVCSLIMAAVLAAAAYLKMRWLVIVNLVLTAFTAVVVFNQRVSSSDAEIAENTLGFYLTLSALVVNFVVTVAILARLRKPAPAVSA